jgi:nicotinamidase-related amidase
MAASDTSAHDLHGSAPDRSEMAVLVLDLISDFDFPGGAAVRRAALPAARRIRRLVVRARRAGVPVIYVNDNLGRWRSDFGAMVRHCARKGSLGAPIVALVAPAPEDYCILKPKHSGFFATPLATLLEYLGARHLVLTGVSTPQCILFTAVDAYVRDYRLSIPGDCVAARTAAEDRLARRFLRSVLRADLRPASRVRVSPSGRGRPAPRR